MRIWMGGRGRGGGGVEGVVGEGVTPMERDLEEGGEDVEVEFPFLMGEVAALIGDVKPAREIVEGMVAEAVECLERGRGFLGRDRGGTSSKL